MVTPDLYLENKYFVKFILENRYIHLAIVSKIIAIRNFHFQGHSERDPQYLYG